MMFLSSLVILALGLTQTQSSCDDISTLDVVFIVDSSGSVYDSLYINWQTELNVVKDIIANSLPADSRVGLINYSGCGSQFGFDECVAQNRMKTEFVLNQYGDPNNLAAVYNKVDSMGPADFNGGYTWTNEALNMSLNMFNDYSTASDFKTIVLITDGEPYPANDHDACKTSTGYESDTLIALKQLGVHIVSVGINISPPNFDEYIECLGQICSVDSVVKHYAEYNLTLHPCEDVFDAKYFTDLTNITSDVVNYICYEEPTMATNSPTKSPNIPTDSPIRSPTLAPVGLPTKSPTKPPTSSPIKSPSKPPTSSPIKSPTKSPTDNPVSQTARPTAPPSSSPSKLPSSSPSNLPTKSPTQLPSSSPSKLPSSSPSKLPTELAVQFTTTGGDQGCEDDESLARDDCDEIDDVPNTCSILIKSSFDVCFVDCYKNRRSKLWNDIKQCICRNIFVNTSFDDNKKKCYINKYHYGNLVNVVSADGTSESECNLVNTFHIETGIFDADCDYLENVYNWLLNTGENLKSTFDECNLLRSETDEYPNGYGAIVSGYIAVELRDKTGKVIESVNTNQSNLCSISVLILLMMVTIIAVLTL